LGMGALWAQAASQGVRTAVMISARFIRSQFGRG
jgi:hypothetical protein